MEYRLATAADIPAMARIRAAEWESQDYWMQRITGYMNGTLHPQQALPERVQYVAVQDGEVLGFIAGHRTRRFECDGELEWINVAAPQRGSGVATELLRLLAGWFVEQQARRICVDPDDSAREFYVRHGAVPLNRHWLVWPDIAVVLGCPGSCAVAS